jgi:SNF2 family DNA or RNA helicase
MLSGIQLHPYQDEAVDRALDRGNLLIAYGMGLGKTYIQLAICEELLGDEEVEVNALVVPASLKWQWAQNIARATDVETRVISMKDEKITVPAQHHCVVVTGTAAQRADLLAYAKRVRPDYVILGYNNVVDDWRAVKRLNPDLIAADEITAIKSFTAERSKALKEWSAPYRFGHTGTPVDNRPEELYSIMEWISPGELGRFDLYDKTYIVRDSYGKPKRYKHLDVLHVKTKAFCARKTRFDSDVAPYMPKDYHKEYFVELGGKTKALYRKIATELTEDLEDMPGRIGWDVESYYRGDVVNLGNAEQGNAMAKFLALSMLCDHPALLLHSANLFDEDFHSGRPVIRGSKYAWKLLKEGHLTGFEKIKSSKTEEVIDKTWDILDESDSSKILIFSFSKKMLDILAARFKTGYVLFTGDLNTAEKEAAKMKFKRDPKTRLFLSSDAGGMGVDLPEANYLINFNHPWSAGKSDQRNSRHIRADSKWDEVFVLNYLVTGSVEEWKFNVLDLKRRVGSAIMDGAPTARGGSIKYDVSQLRKWLKEHL